ncbi:hypothetical protein H5410_047042 [Solanum commersonii]|uniref:Enoyl reductase (ER) domain-containing protein n=1 Tax=Solanum commersonii TaxID=4109 RepID=A0A9J5XI29_SOLCO|nr:hypothetical protein H5410_047042 [Solanum commersonii]
MNSAPPKNGSLDHFAPISETLEIGESYIDGKVMHTVQYDSYGNGATRLKDKKVLEVFVGDSIRNSIQEMKDSISKDLAECRSMLLEVLGEKDTTSFEPKNIVMDVKLGQFRDENLDAWIVQAEHYFNFYKIEEDQKLNVASFYLDGEALEWCQWLFRNNQLIDWMHFTKKVRIQFKQRKYVSLQEVPSVTEYPNSLEVVSSDFCQPDILLPCLTHVTDSPLPQNYDEQSEYPIKIDEHKVFDEIKVQLFYGHPQIDMSERYVTTTSLDCWSCKQEIGFNFFEDMYLNESGIPISELLQDEMTSKDVALTGYTVKAETLLLLGSTIDVGGEVVEVGSNVKSFKAGDKVVAMLNALVGPIRFKCFIFATSLLRFGAWLKLNRSYSSQALANPAEVKLDGTGPRKNILVTATSGGVGHYVVQLAKLGNTHVTATCGACNIDFVKSLGTDEVLDYKTPEGATLKSPSGQKYDAVIHCTTGIPWSTFEPNLSSSGKVIDITPGVSAMWTFAVKKLTFKEAVGATSFNSQEGEPGIDCWACEGRET